MAENQTSSRNEAEVVAFPPRDQSQAVLIISLWSDILNARLLAILALVGALGIFGYTIGDPSALRLWGCTGYSVGILWPVIWLYLKRGGKDGT